jgi:hypothetical protein
VHVVSGALFVVLIGAAFFLLLIGGPIAIILARIYLRPRRLTRQDPHAALAQQPSAAHLSHYRAADGYWYTSDGRYVGRLAVAALDRNSRLVETLPASKPTSAFQGATALS